MNQYKHISMVLFFVFSLNGCIVWSVNRFYTDGLKTEFREIVGEWQIRKSHGENVENKHIKNWIFKETSIVTFDDKDRSSILQIQIFKINDVYFGDVAAGESNSETIYWLATLLPMHTLVKIELEQDTLVLTPMSRDFLYEDDNEIVQHIPYIKYEGQDGERIYIFPGAMGGFP
jgi:hypothetical protein